MPVNASSANSIDGLWLSPPVVAALLALFGALVALVGRDVFMAIYLAQKKREEELSDKNEETRKANHDFVRLYSDPLKVAVTNLKYRLHEILVENKGKYLLVGAPNIPFLEYKRISTLYRISCVLGWIRAIRRERSYLDPEQASNSIEMKTIKQLEAALADGTHVELRRLNELSKLWHVPEIDPKIKERIAYLIDSELGGYLAKKNVLSSSDLPDVDQIDLANLCADVIDNEAKIRINRPLVITTAKTAAVFLGIKEAYIYRDWQAAIGDLMLTRDEGGVRHFSVHGFGTFEDMFLEARKSKRSNTARWFDRLETLIHDLEPESESGLIDFSQNSADMGNHQPCAG